MSSGDPGTSKGRTPRDDRRCGDGEPAPRDAGQRAPAEAGPGIAMACLLALLLLVSATGYAAVSPAEEALKGAWFDPSASGQGVLIDVLEQPSGGNILVGSWYTYHKDGGRKLWLTMSGPAAPTAQVQRLKIHHVEQNGVFGQPPDVSASSAEVGTAELEMVAPGQLVIRFQFPAATAASPWPASGSLRLAKIAYADPGGLSPHQLVTAGIWYDPASSGQGINASLFPATDGGTLLVMSWFTYSEDRSQKIWLTLSGPASQRGTHLMDIYQTENGRFNQPPSVRNVKVGVALVNVVTANRIKVGFVFDVAGPWGQRRQGELSLVRLGSPPAMPGVIDTSDRAKVIEAYRTRYLAPFPAMQWTGNAQTCTAGTTSVAFQQRVIDQLNYFRGMAGFSAVALRANDEATQQAALMMDANNATSHTPPPSWRCYSEAGASAAFRSNLWMTSGMQTRVVDAYMDDFGDINASVGHRYAILSELGVASTGDTMRANALGWIAAGGVGVLDQTPWPPAGFVPLQILPRVSNRWSFQMIGADLSQSVISMRNVLIGQTFAIRREVIRETHRAVWQVLGLPTAGSSSSPITDLPIEVTISNVRVGTESRRIVYTVTIIDPG